MKKLLSTHQIYSFSHVFLDNPNQYIYDKMLKQKLKDLLLGQNLMFLAVGVPNSGKSYSIFGNKVLCDPYLLEFMESIPAKGKQFVTIR